MSNLSIEGIFGAFLVIIGLLTCYNTFSTSRKNARDEMERHEAPLNNIREDIGKLKEKDAAYEQRIAELERRADALELDSKDLHAGQSALCRGVQALLEHELHNGNETEMKKASDGISEYLRSR